MNPEVNQKIHMVLRHDNVLGRGDKLIHSSVTQIDLHDFSRLCLTYGLGGFHCITQMESQHRIANDILQYWRDGFGADYNPDRNQALAMLHLHTEFEEVVENVQNRWQQKPLIIGTTAKKHDKILDFGDLSSIIVDSGRPAILQFGTSWGLSDDQMHRCDWVLPPIEGQAGYNHLSVRCAAAILVDRLCT